MGTWSRLRVVPLLFAHFSLSFALTFLLSLEIYMLDEIAIVVQVRSRTVQNYNFFFSKAVVHSQSASADEWLFIFSPKENYFRPNIFLSTHSYQIKWFRLLTLWCDNLIHHKKLMMIIFGINTAQVKATDSWKYQKMSVSHLLWQKVNCHRQHFTHVSMHCLLAFLLFLS